MPGEEVQLSLADKFKDTLENGYKRDIYTIMFIDILKEQNRK